MAVRAYMRPRVAGQVGQVESVCSVPEVPSAQAEYSPFVHRVIDLLAYRDLANAGHVNNPEAWLKTARHRRWLAHKHQLTVQGLADLLEGRHSLRRDYAHAKPSCATCDSTGWTPTDDLTDHWQRCERCNT